MAGEVKKGKAEAQEYDAHRVQELLRCAMDPAYFVSKYVKIQHPTKGMIPFKLYPYQVKMLHSMKNNRNTIILSARQTGKSQTSAAFLLWYAIFNEDKGILIASNKNSNALEMISRIRYMYESVPDWLKPAPTKDGWNKLSVAFTNKSKIHSCATSESSGRGLAISLLYCDELAFVGRNIQEEFWRSISPTLSTGGACIISSTPNGEGDKFANLWHGAKMGTNDFHPVFVAWNEPPGRDEKFKKDNIGKLGMLAWRQEYECEFLTSEALLIDPLFLNNVDEYLKKNQIVPISQNMGVNWYAKLKTEGTYLIGVDPSSGSGNDYSAIQIFDFPTLVQVGEFRSNQVSSPQLYGIIKYILKEMDKVNATVYYSIENNGVGEGVIALQQNDEEASETAQFVSEQGKNREGMTTTARSKMKACLNLKNLLESNKFKIKSNVLLTELKTYAVHGGAYAALPGSTDDLVSPCLIVIRLLAEIASYEQAAFDTLYKYEEQLHPSDDQDGFSDYDGNGPIEEPMPMIF